MSKPKLIACALAGLLAAAASHAQEPTTTPSAGAVPAPPWATPQPRPAPPLPDWVKERRAHLGIEEAPTADASAIQASATDDAVAAAVEPTTTAEPADMPSIGRYERPAIPDWVVEQRAEMTQQERPEPPMRPAPPKPPEWVKPNPPAAPAGPGPMPPMREVSDAPAGPTWVIERPDGATSGQETAGDPETGAVARLAIGDVPEAPARPEPPARPESPQTPAKVSVAPEFTPPARPETARPETSLMAPRQSPTWAAERPAPMQVPEAPVRPPRPEQPEISAAIATPMAPQPPQQPEWGQAMPDPLAMTHEAPALPEVRPPVTGPAVYPAPWGGGYPGGGYPGGGYPGWGYPGGGWGNGWMPWNNSGWGNGWGNDWMPWGSGWGNDWNNGYGVGDGWGGLGSDGYGGGTGEADFSFAMSARASADMTGHGHGDGYGDGWGHGWGHQGYGYPGYGYAPPPYPVMPADTEGTVVDEGPADGDADGVSDASDLCPDTAPGMTVDALGCDIEARIVLQGVNFKTDSDELTESSLTILDGVSATLSAHPEIRVIVAGHTDSDGDDVYNKDLSQRRAQRVVDYLSDNGVDSDNLVARGFGEEQPIATNDSAEGKAANRRVELNRL